MSMWRETSRTICPTATRWRTGEAQVSLRSLAVLAGDPLPREARRVLLQHLDAIVAAWNALDPWRLV
jgi:hypothetical protein